jgi:hypothetical protein
MTNGVIAEVARLRAALVPRRNSGEFRYGISFFVIHKVMYCASASLNTSGFSSGER